MLEFDSNTERKVFEAGKIIFARRGFRGARMQEIADLAGINKSLLHYYFRSKENLFKLVFEDTFTSFINSISYTMDNGNNFKDVLYNLIDKYLNFLKNNPYIVQFILTMGLQDIDIIKSTTEKIKVDPKPKILSLIKKELLQRNITDVEPIQILINIISMLLFPFLAKPILINLFDIKSDKEFEKIIEPRKKIITETILNYLEMKQTESKK